MVQQETTDRIDFMDIVRMHPDSILLVNGDNRIIFANTAGLRLLCRLPAAGDHLPDYMDIPADAEQIISLLDIAGHEVVLNIQNQPIQWHGSAVRLFCITDVSEETKQRRSLENLVYSDYLTGLYNRRGFEQLAIKMISTAQRQHRTVSLFYIDVNGLKLINDELGHASGDAAIIETAELLKHSFRESDIIARVGGDEFVVLVSEDAPYCNDIILARLQMQIDKRNHYTHQTYQLSLSIGIVQHDNNSQIDVHNLIRQADKQMYRARRNRHRQLFGIFRNNINTPHPALLFEKGVTTTCSRLSVLTAR